MLEQAKPAEAATSRQRRTNFTSSSSFNCCNCGGRGHYAYQCLRVVVLHILTNKIKTTINPCIIEDLCTDVLLGGDFYKKYKTDISYYFKNLTVRPSQQPKKRIKFEEHKNTSRLFYIKTFDDTIIPLLSSRAMQAITTASHMTTAVFTPSVSIWNYPTIKICWT
ncbi:unnamed protein product [Didymodactylos carnosus]|uniref:CCHC-type domain-containing protein n=1 Tax=Didymodactylos carnosus TaxID=1234261 RepID=A0A816DRC2_9BILA|nr:unnamed protein product [Didymodactylos carnosus]CAF4555753.1 unnamed protein product [Didymodactylos carnosus]